MDKKPSKGSPNTSYNSKFDKNFIIFIVVSVVVLLGWSIAFPPPKKGKSVSKADTKAAESLVEEVISSPNVDGNNIDNKNDIINEPTSPTIVLENDYTRAVFDVNKLSFVEITNKKFFDKIGTSHKEIMTVEEGNVKSKIGFVGVSDLNWRVEKKSDVSFLLNAEKNGVNYSVVVTNPNPYLFQIKSQISNNSKSAYVGGFYTAINKNYDKPKKRSFVSSEGFSGYLDGEFMTMKYSKIAKKERLSYPYSSGSWFGFGSKYFANFIISKDFDEVVVRNQNSLYQSYSLKNVSLNAGESKTFSSVFYSGPKIVEILDKYGEEYGAIHTDRMIDFGMWYFVTKPILIVLKWINGIIGNFGLSIIVLTILVKMALMPLSTKSYISMSKMKALAPQVNSLKKLHEGNKVATHQAMSRLYKNAGVSPLSGCMPVLFQIPIFFALYKVFLISIDLRQADFMFWIHDLSLPDPTNVFNLFGLIPFDVPFLNVGFFPILLGFTMFLQQSLNPKTNEMANLSVIKYMPIIFTFIFASFPMGLILYWIVSNVFSYLHQYTVEKHVMKKFKSQYAV